MRPEFITLFFTLLIYDARGSQKTRAAEPGNRLHLRRDICIMQLAKRILNIHASATIALNNRAMELKAKGLDIIDLTAGQPDFPTPEPVKNAGITAIQNNHTRYIPMRGLPELLRAVSDKLERENHIRYLTEEILVSCGGKHSLYLAMQALLEPGDEALLLAPYWTSYPPQVELAGAEPVILPSEQENDFKVTRDDLERARTARTKVLVLNNPSNPTGSVYSRDEIGSIAAFAVEHGIIILSDEIYERLTFDGEPAVSPASVSDEAKNITVTINGVSKSFAMTGWRIGYAAGPRHIIDAMARLQSHDITHPASIAEYAACTALAECGKTAEEMRNEFERRRNFVVERLKKIPDIMVNVPKGAFYIFPRINAFFGRGNNGKRILNSMDLSLYLLEEAHVGTVPGSGFGDDRFIRISFAQSMKQLEEGIQRLEKGLSRLL